VPRRLDRLAKRICREVLASEGRIETEREVDPEVQQVDVWFEPFPARAASLAQLGLFGRLCTQPVAIEAYSQAPDLYELRACVRKHLGLLHLEGEDLPDRPEPWMWVICAGRPTAGLEALKCGPASEFTPGVYLAPSLLRLGIVVVGELPTDRETLLVRLLGRGKVFEQAMKELGELPIDAPERQKVLPVLQRYYRETGDTRAEGRVQVQEEEEEEDRRIMKDFFEQLHAKGHSQGLKHGLEQGLIAAFEARFGVMPADLHALVGGIRDKRTLRECFRFIGAATTQEAHAGIRAKVEAPRTPRSRAAHRVVQSA
jgi:hypothetical protein